jgi:hypothetical protein
LKGFVGSPGLIGDEKKDFVEFVGSMLKLAPEERLSATDLLGMKWLHESPV